MSLFSALHVGRTGLETSQAALEVVGNNLANVATEGYTRQRAVLATNPSVEIQPGTFIGTGVKLEAIVRQVDEALNTRLRAALADQQGASARQDILVQLESIEADLTDQGLTSRLSQFFNAWSELANDPTDNGLRALVVSEGASLSDFVRSLRKEMGDVRTQVDNSLRTAVQVADSLVDRVAELNQEIVVSEAGQGGANGLRDERDRVLDELATYLDIQTIEQPGGGVNVLVNSVPLVLGTESRGLAVEFETAGSALEIRLRVPADGSSLTPTSGRIGSLLSARSGDVDAAIGTLDTFTTQFVNQVNRLHASGQSGRGFDALTSDNFALDPSLALNDPDAGLSFVVDNGTLQFHVTQLSSDTRTSAQIHIDLDGIGGDTTLNDLAAALDAAANVSASVTAGGRLQISADSPDFAFSFSDDSSGVLAAMGLNTFFSGDQATNMAVNPLLLSDPTRVATAQNHVSGDNRTALGIADLGQASVPGLNGLTLREYWARHVEDFAIRTAQTRQQASASDVIVGGLETQRAGISGVSLDEEAINMLTYEKAYQAAARFITVIDELTDTLLGLLR